MSSNAENTSLTDILQKVNSWQGFMDILPPGLMEEFGGYEQFFLLHRMLDINTPQNAPISKNAFRTLVAVRRDSEKGRGFVPLTAEEADTLLSKSIEKGIVSPVEKDGSEKKYTPNPHLKEAIIRFDENEPKS